MARLTREDGWEEDTYADPQLSKIVTHPYDPQHRPQIDATPLLNRMWADYWRRIESQLENCPPSMRRSVEIRTRLCLGQDPDDGIYLEGYAWWPGRQLYGSLGELAPSDGNANYQD